MAKCKKVNIEKVRYKLSLTEQEAEFLYRLLGNHVTGGGLRRVGDGIFLSLAGNNFSDRRIDTDGQCAIHIKEKK